MFARGAPEDHTEIDRSRLALDLASLVRAYLLAMRRGAGTRRYQPRPLTLWSVQGRAAAAGALLGSLPDWTSLDQFLPDDARRPAGAPRARWPARCWPGWKWRAAARCGCGRSRRSAQSWCAAPPGGVEEATTMTAPAEEALRLAEALVFASAGPVGARALSQLLPETVDADAVLAALRERYAGRGVELVEVGGGVQFRTAPDLAPRLRKVIEVPRRLPRVAMETLAIIAYHQPVTRPEIEEIRGTSLSQQTLDALLEADLIAPQRPPGKPRPADTVGHHAALPRPVRPERPARTAAPRGPAAGAACRWSVRRRDGGGAVSEPLASDH